MPVGFYDPDYSSGGGKRPSWSVPRTDLAKRAMAVSGRKYFRGTSKHISEYEDWNRIEEKAMGSTEEHYLYLQWVEHNISKAEEKWKSGIPVPFAWLMGNILNDEDRIDWVGKNRSRLLKERGSTELSGFDTANKLARDKILDEE